MQISKETQAIIAAKFQQAPSVSSFRKEMTKLGATAKLAKSLSHKGIISSVKGKR